MSRILNRQRQLAESGRLRLGWTETYERDGRAKSRPVKSTTWVLSSHAKDIVEAAAEKWGGVVEKWQPLGNGAEQYRVITSASAIDAILPPGDPLTQAYETWSKGGCQRRCDGATELLSGSPCLCIREFGDSWYEQPKGRVCDTKTRLKVLLPDLPGVGSYRVETGSYYAADEIAGMVDFLRAAVGDQTLVPVRLRIEPRTRVAGGQTKQFIVPVLELRGYTAGQVLESRGANLMSVGAAPARAEIGAGPAQLADAEVVALAADCVDGEAVRDLWRRLHEQGSRGALAITAERLTEILQARAAELDAAATGSDDEPVTGHVVDDDGDEAAAADAWFACVAAAGELGMSTDDLQDAYAEAHNGDLPGGASAAELLAFRDELRSRGAAA